MLNCHQWSLYDSSGLGPIRFISGPLDIGGYLKPEFNIVLLYYYIHSESLLLLLLIYPIWVPILLILFPCHIIKYSSTNRPLVVAVDLFCHSIQPWLYFTNKVSVKIIESNKFSSYTFWGDNQRIQSFNCGTQESLGLLYHSHCSQCSSLTSTWKFLLPILQLWVVTTQPMSNSSVSRRTSLKSPAKL